MRVNFDVGDQEDLQYRLKDILSDSSNRKVHFLIGAGASVGAAPTTADLAELMRKAADLPATDVPADSTIYQQYARKLKLRRTDGMRDVFRFALFDHHPKWLDRNNIPSFDSGVWSIPPNQAAIANFYDAVPSDRRGMIITTNFDPLTEAALHERGISCNPLLGHASNPIQLSAVTNAIPVVHLHGFWSEGKTLNTDAELLAAREDIGDQLLRYIDGGDLLVLGYSGWNDLFTRHLIRAHELGRLSSDDLQIVWMHHSSASSNSSEVLKALSGSPSLVQFEHIDFPEVSSAAIRESALDGRKDGPQIGSLTTILPNNLIRDPNRDEIARFVNGAAPSISVSSSAPRLKNYYDLRSAISQSLARNSDQLVIAVGPSGEGKSVAVQQVALDLAESDEHLVVMMNLGSSGLSADEIRVLRRREERVILIVDEADLRLTSVVASLQETRTDGGPVCILGAMHSQFEHLIPKWAMYFGAVQRVGFEGLEIPSDAFVVAKFWREANSRPQSLEGKSDDEAVRVISEVTAGSGEASLFGGLLRLWNSSELKSRVSDMLARLSRKSISGISLDDMLRAIAITEEGWAGERALTSEALGTICGISSADVARLVIAPLGREASISTRGNEVFVRHPAIRVEILRQMDEKERKRIANIVGRAGGALRMMDAPSEHHHQVTGLIRRLHGGVGDALSAGILSSSDLLETRTSYFARLRDERDSNSTLKVRQTASVAEQYPDFSTSGRGFYVEWAHHEFISGDIERAMAIGVYSLGDSFGAPLTRRQTEVAVTALRSFLRRIPKDRRARELYMATIMLDEFVQGNSISSPGRGDGRAGSSPTASEVVTQFRRATSFLIPRMPVEAPPGFSQLVSTAGRLRREKANSGVGGDKSVK